jgi:SNF2 family DNA or RNA helicase
LTGQSNEKWSLAINLRLDPQSDSQTIDLLGLLNQLHTLDFGPDQRHRSLLLDDGRILLLPADKLHGLAEELADLVGSDAGEFQFNGNQLARLDSIQQALPDDTQWSGDTALLDRAKAIHRQPHSIATDKLPLNAQLRDYQQTGICWLQHIKQHKVHGLLADDMGLGKTLQTIAHLCLEKYQGILQQPALVIAPTSLLHNWAAEISRFAPQLSFQIIHGAQRHQHWQQLHQYDLLITSYALVAKDLSLWQQQALSWVILDEAQTIKNPRTKIRRAVVQLDCQYRLCLSGTPIQNHLGELWSIFDFLMPGCLDNEREFKQFFRKPIEEQADKLRFQQLLKRISPFMLRRSKDQVAADLPQKTEVDQTIIMDSDQQALYDEIKTKSWWQLQQDMREESNSGKQQIQVLTALLKLRQVCCDPQLIGELNTSSAKRQHCIEMISELVAEQRSMLVFSQFTSMLDLLARDLKEKNIPYLMLTGESQHRQQRVDAFQAGEAPVFLISLKAGGVGLNLTRADTVIHYDPWWNSAAQQQATDRAHRIGQDKPVFVYNLIMEASIEEKIAQLQLRKAQLGQQLGEQAQNNSEQFALKLNELLALIQDD